MRHIEHGHQIGPPLQHRDHLLLTHHRAARRVDERAVRLHAGQVRARDHALGLGQPGCVHRHDSGAAEDILERTQLHAERRSLLRRHERIVGDDAHGRLLEQIHQRPADDPQGQDAHDRAVGAGARQLLVRPQLTAHHHVLPARLEAEEHVRQRKLCHRHCAGGVGAADRDVAGDHIRRDQELGAAADMEYGLQARRGGDHRRRQRRAAPRRDDHVGVAPRIRMCGKGVRRLRGQVQIDHLLEARQVVRREELVDRSVLAQPEEAAQARGGFVHDVLS